jgi:hypothetical protein
MMMESSSRSKCFTPPIPCWNVDGLSDPKFIKWV